MKITEETVCRACPGELESVMDLGEIYLSGFVRHQSEAQKAPLELAKCKECGLVQLKHTVDLDNMYRQYWYSSSLNRSMVSSLEDVVRYVEGIVSLEFDDVVLDIGCNDGTLLGLYKTSGLCKVGFDPALNLPKPFNCYFINDYFKAQSLRNICGQDKAKVITAIAMYYDLPDPVEFTKDVASVLEDDGIFVIQFTDLLSMYKAIAFDNICHEHLEYYRLTDVMKILDKAGLEAIDVSYNKVNGGSLRVTAAHKGQYDPSRSVEYFKEIEEDYLEHYGIEEFKDSVQVAILQVKEFLKAADRDGQWGILLGASTKGNTLLQVCGINSKMIPFAAEVNKDKFGLFTVGTHIRIIPENIF